VSRFDRARELVAAEQYKKAVSALWEAENSAVADPDNARELLELASAVRDRTEGRLRGECETLIDDAQRYIRTQTGSPNGAAAGLSEPPQTTAGTPPNVGGGVITICGGLLAVLSAFLPWMSAHVLLATLDRNAFQLGANLGFSADGLVLVLLGLVAVLIGITRAVRASMPPFVQRSPIIVGIGLAVVPAARVGSISHLAQSVSANSSLASASVGFGLWLAFFAAAITFIGGLVLRSKAPAGATVAAVTATSSSPSPAEAIPSAPTSNGSASESSAPVTPAADVEERLRKLNELRDKELVTVQEYETKRAALLSEL
jgi:hypothetical protein